MAKPSEKLAEPLQALHELQAHGTVAIRSADLSRTHRERLLRNGFLQEVIKGWYVPTRPDETVGESTAWYAAFWPFCTAYLQHLSLQRIAEHGILTYVFGFSGRSKIHQTFKMQGLDMNVTFSATDTDASRVMCVSVSVLASLHRWLTIRFPIATWC